MYNDIIVRLEIIKIVRDDDKKIYFLLYDDMNIINTHKQKNQCYIISVHTNQYK